MVVRVGQEELDVVVAGEGPDVLLIHGFPDDHTVWRNQIPALVSAGYRVIAPDTRGRGASSAPLDVKAYRIARLVEDLIGVLDALEATNVRVVGHDWGAAIGWALCMRHPERVNRYVAVSVGHPNAFARAPLSQKLKSWYIFAFLFPGVSEWVVRFGNWFSLRRTYPEESDHWVDILSKPGRLTAALNYYRANLRLALPRDYPSVHFPVMGVWSSNDRFLGEAQMLGTAKFVQGPWRYERVDGANHWVQLDGAAAFTPLLLDYLA